MSPFNDPIDEVTHRVKDAIADEMAHRTREKFWVTHYGANHIHPRHLVYWIVVQSDREKARLMQDAALARFLRGILETLDYPAEGRDGVMIGFESHETVDREARGDFWGYWR